MENIFEYFKEYLGGKREETITNHEASMLTAISWSLKSKDPSTQVGACIIHEDGRLLTAGYNGTPKGWDDESFPWDNKVSKIGEQNTKYPYVVHAEMNAICNYKGSNLDLKNSTIYVTLFPCANCAKLIVQSGIKRVIYLVDDRKDSLDESTKRENLTTKLLLAKCGVEVISFDELKTINEVNVSLSENNKKNIKIIRLENKTNS